MPECLADVAAIVGKTDVLCCFAKSQIQLTKIRRETIMFFMRKPIICPNANCGYKGPAKKKSRGSSIVFIVLLMFGILPGILYAVFRSGYRYECPQCGIAISADN